MAENPWDPSKVEGFRPYGLDNPWDRPRRFAKTPDRTAGVGRHATDWNAQLTNQHGNTIKMWIHDFESGFELQGEKAQSRFYRQFFPRNFAQPKVTVKGRVANYFEYNRLAAFIRQSHYDSLTAAQVGRAEGDNNTSATVTLKLRQGGIKARHNAKGKRRGWQLDGYIMSVPAGVIRHNTAPEFQFDFVIAASAFNDGTVGIYEDTLYVGRQIMSWMDVFHQNQKKGLWSGKGYADPASSKPNTAEELAKDVGSVLGSIFDLFD